MNDGEKLVKKIAVRLPLTLYEQVMDKARRESVNISAFLRARLREWVETEAAAVREVAAAETEEAQE